MCRTIYQTNKSHQWLTKMTLPVFCFVLFTVTVTSGFILGPGNGPMCRQCEVAIHPSACMKTGQCLKNQECYTETYTASDSTRLYRLGCISAHICRISVQSTNDTACFSCCQTDNCNTNLCPSSTCRKPYYGPICTDVCGHCANQEQCNQITGRCENGCVGAYLPPYCRSTSPEVCSGPFHGPYCTDTCGHCSSGEQCDKDTGRCLNGCDSGFVAPYCNSVCPRHSYGLDCRNICGRCAGEDVCDPRSGVCRKGCEPGVVPPFCSAEVLNGRDCADIKKKFNTTTSGIYQVITPMNQKLEVWCDMTTDSEGWIVFQRRTNDAVQFNRTWAAYKDGFGYIYGSFWWGNENLASFTSSHTSVLRIDMVDAKGQHSYSEHQGFYVEHENEHFRLHLGNFHGNASDSMSYNNGMQFSTKDQDNDGHSDIDCAQFRQSGWWFHQCTYANLNGIYGLVTKFGLLWTITEPLTWAEMKFRST